jgi:glycogen operon protein
MHFLTGVDTNHDDHPDLSWHGLEVGRPDWSDDSEVLAFMLDGSELDEDRPDDDFLVLLNGDKVKQTFEMLQPRKALGWTRIVDTSKPSPRDIMDEDGNEAVFVEGRYTVPAGAAVVFISKRR